MSFNKNSKWFASGLVLVGIVVGVALVSAGTAVVHWSGSTQFCGTFCHSMDRVYAAYQHGLHGKTNVGVEVGCVDCHLKYESEKSISQAQVVGLLWHKAMSGSSSLWGEIRGTMSTPEKQKAMQNELSEKYLKWPRSTGFQNCRGCHDLNNFKVNPAKPMVAPMHKMMADTPEADCIECHKTAGHDYEAIDKAEAKPAAAAKEGVN